MWNEEQDNRHQIRVNKGDPQPPLENDGRKNKTNRRADGSPFDASKRKLNPSGRDMSVKVGSGKIADLTKEEIEILFEGLPRVEMTEDTLLIDSLVSLKAASSKREARDFINGGGVSINGNQQKDMNFVITDECTIGEEYTIIRRGKKNYYVIKHVK